MELNDESKLLQEPTFLSNTIVLACYRPVELPKSWRVEIHWNGIKGTYTLLK